MLSFGAIANDIFILIAGYFMAERESINLFKSAKKLIGQLVFASILLVIIPIFIINEETGNHITLFTTDSINGWTWFVGYYFAVIFIAQLGFNRFLQKRDQKQYAAVVISLFALITFSWSWGVLSAIGSGLETIVLGLFLYSLGGYIRKYNPFYRIRAWVLIAVILICNLFIWISEYNSTQLRIEEYFNNGSEGEFVQSFITYSNKNFVVIVIAVCLFELFKRIPSFHSRVVNYLGSATFMVYLIHENTFFHNEWNNTDWNSLLANSKAEFLLQLIETTLAVFAMGLVAYTCYTLLLWLVKKCSFLFVRKNKNEA